MSTKTAALQALTQPMAITERWLHVLASWATDPKSAGIDKAVTLPGAVEAPDTDGVRVVNVSGPLSKEPSIFQWIFGGTDYTTIKREIGEALQDGAPVVLNIDSPGGEVFGCSELADYIYGLRAAGATIKAYISGQGDSAAYWIASSCEDITINASGEAGSIGVRCLMVDDSKLQEAMGIKAYDIVADQSPLKVADASDAKDRARVKAQMSAFAEVFVASVARGRGVSASKVLSDFGRGDVMVGQAAVDAGLADKVGSLDSVLAELSANNPKEKEMKTPITAAAPEQPVASVGNGKCSSCRSALADKDPMYCKSCMKDDDDDDDDAKKAKSFHAAVMALLSETDEAKAIGALTGYKAQAEQATAKCAELEKQLAAVSKSKADAEVAQLLDAAIADGRIKPAAREKFEKLYADHGASALDAAMSVLTPAQSVAVPATDDKAAEAAKTAAAALPKNAVARVTAALSDEQIRIIKATGSTPEKYLEHRAKLFANLPTEEK